MSVFLNMWFLSDSIKKILTCMLHLLAKRTLLIYIALEYAPVIVNVKQKREKLSSLP